MAKRTLTKRKHKPAKDAAKVIPQDIKTARDIWHRDAPAAFRLLLDAKSSKVRRD